MLKFLQQLFGAKNTLDCPICRQEISLEDRTCPNCKSEVPQLYASNWGQGKLISVPTVGATNHGKTVFLQALIHTLDDLSDSGCWSGITIEPANEITNAWIREIRRARKEGRLPEPTQLKAEEALILLIQNIPLWGTRLLVIRDVAGEAYDKSFRFHESQRAFCQVAKCAFVVIDINDLDASPELTLDSMLLGYVRSLEAAGSKVVGEMRKIVIVFSKADMLREKLPTHLAEYIDNDPVRGIIDGFGQPNVPDSLSTPMGLANYRELGLETLNQHIRKWITGPNQKGGNKLLALADQYGIELKFTLTSGWGQDPGQKTKMNPRRIYDPFFWLLDFHSEALK